MTGSDDQAVEQRGLARREVGGQIASRQDTSTALIDTFVMPDIYDAGETVEQIGLEAIATISAGEKRYKDANGRYTSYEPTEFDKFGTPFASRDGRICLHDPDGRAPTLMRALERTRYQSLTVAFPHDDPSEFIKWFYSRYSTSKLEAFGDSSHIMLLSGGRYVRIDKAEDPEGYEREKRKCKAYVSIYFCLAGWGKSGPGIVLDDGMGAFYRLRFTSRHSLRSILRSLRETMKFTGGRVAGLPFELSIAYKEVADGTGSKRYIPYWTALFKTADGLRLTSRNWLELAEQGLEQGRLLKMPALPAPTIGAALRDGPELDLDASYVDVVVVEPTDEQIDTLARGGTCDFEHWLNYWHGAVKGTWLDQKAARAEFLSEWTTKHWREETDSLAYFLNNASEEEAGRLVLAAQVATGQVHTLRGGGAAGERHVNENFWAAVGKTSALRDDENRAEFVGAFTREWGERATSSLSELAERATRREADEFLAAVADFTRQEFEARRESGAPASAPSGYRRSSRNYEQIVNTSAEDDLDPIGAAQRRRQTRPVRVEDDLEGQGGASVDPETVSEVVDGEWRVELPHEPDLAAGGLSVDHLRKHYRLWLSAFRNLEPEGEVPLPNDTAIDLASLVELRQAVEYLMRVTKAAHAAAFPADDGPVAVADFDMPPDDDELEDAF